MVPSFLSWRQLHFLLSYISFFFFHRPLNAQQHVDGFGGHGVGDNRTDRRAWSSSGVGSLARVMLRVSGSNGALIPDSLGQI
jgi:hypothetical protein